MDNQEPTNPNRDDELEDAKRIIINNGNELYQDLDDTQLEVARYAMLGLNEESMAIMEPYLETDELTQLASISLPVHKLGLSGLYAYSTLAAKKKSAMSHSIPVASDSSVPVAPLPTPPIGNIPVAPIPVPTIPTRFYSEELRLDVDGRYPQMAASGTIISLLQNIHWIASLKKTGANQYEGPIWYTHGYTAGFKFTHVKVVATNSIYPSGKKAKVTFSGSGIPDRTITLKFKSAYFRNVEFEYDYEEGIVPVTKINTHAHPNRPATTVKENLSIETVFKRAGFNTSKTLPVENNTIPPALKGADGLWSDTEMHDAMQTYWSKFADAPQWSLWTFFARQHELGYGLGGIMFDEIGSNHRQGTAIFYDSFVSEAPAGDPKPAAYVARMKFWTTVHEMGHAFNLAHSWQKSLGNRWIPGLADEPEARSFMNYPYNVSGGPDAFFADFEYRFSNQELLFMRHAPNEFVQMGNAAWFDNHGFQWAEVSHEPKFEFILRVNRPEAEFEFMEAINIELKLKNVSPFPQVVDEAVLADMHHMTFVIKRNNDPAKQYYPFANYCFKENQTLLQPGASLYASTFISAGTKGWIIDEPGYYIIQACIHNHGEDIVSNPLRIRVAPPRRYEESYLAQDYFSDEVARIYSFNGSMVLQNGIATLREVSDRLKDSKVAAHANFALAKPFTRNYKMLDFQTDAVLPGITAAADINGKIKIMQANPEEANKLYEKAFTTGTKNGGPSAKKIAEAAETVGHISLKKQAEAFTESLLKEGNTQEARQVLEQLVKVFNAKNVLKSVTEEIKTNLQAIKEKK
jgi:hypothetical protein